VDKRPLDLHKQPPQRILIAPSVSIAMVASYTALDPANSVGEGGSRSRNAWNWLGAGAVSMGTHIWAMHFIGKLAFILRVPVAYILPITTLSMSIAVAGSAIVLFVPRQAQTTLLSGGCCLNCSRASRMRHCAWTGNHGR
jgi:NO-binding membrane sensor protein with MHYT domain